MTDESNLLPTSILDSIREKSTNPQEFLYESLLWRGFLVDRDEKGGLSLYRGSHDDDLARLVKLGCSLDRLHEGEFVAKISVAPENASAVAERVLGLAPMNHMTGALRQKETEGSFFTCEYGVKATTVELDPGVALFVKALPVCGLRTVLSCQGHLGRETLWPEIYFHSKYDLLWAVIIFEELGNYLPEFSGLNFKVDEEHRGGWLRHKLIFCSAESLSSAEPFGPEYTDTIVSLQMAARRLLDPRVYTPIRAAKHSTTDFGGLREALCRELKVLG